MSKSPAVDAYIAKSAEFAHPILRRVRAAVHKACPQIEETIKWGVPFFEYKGVVANMAAFKRHASFGFWKQRLMDDPAGLFPARGDSSMGGKKFRSAAELPSDAVLIRYVRAAMALNDRGAKVPRPARKKRPPPKPPADLVAAFSKNRKAKEAFDSLSPSHRREYVEWITEAKRDETRRSRLERAIQWMAQGKPRNWKYQNR
jgi:uncharacterized protein YdeI (YjbR/CyaY-like superfamily)